MSSNCEIVMLFCVLYAWFLNNLLPLSAGSVIYRRFAPSPVRSLDVSPPGAWGFNWISRSSSFALSKLPSYVWSDRWRHSRSLVTLLFDKSQTGVFSLTVAAWWSIISEIRRDVITWETNRSGHGVTSGVVFLRRTPPSDWRL